ncbi:MAG: hypothetical protein ACE5GX_10655 [Thermoanaerobaculia bacterium]
MPRKPTLSGIVVAALVVLLGGTHVIAEDGHINVDFDGWINLEQKTKVKKTPMLVTSTSVPRELFDEADSIHGCVDADLDCRVCAFRGNKPVKGAKFRARTDLLIIREMEPFANNLDTGFVDRYVLDLINGKTEEDGCSRWSLPVRSGPPGRPPRPGELVAPEPLDPPPLVLTTVQWRNGKKVTQTESQCDLNQLESPVVIC